MKQKLLLLFAVLLFNAGAWASLLSYELTDEVGNVYTGTYDGVAGTDLPTFTGVTLSSTVWEDNKLYAKITFPFPVSGNETTKKMMINGYTKSSQNFKWYAKDNTYIKVYENSAPTTANVASYLWAIYPTLNEGAFTYTIKNIATGKYITSSATSGAHANNTLGFSDTGISFTLVQDSWGYAFKVADKNLYLSINSSTDGKGEQPLGLHGNTHDGTSLSFIPYVVNYTLTDEANNVFTGEAEGSAELQIEPAFTGVANLVLSNKAWEGNTFTANVSFPFPVSSASVTNPTLIVNGASWGNPNSRKWRAATVEGTDYVKIQTAAVNQGSTDALWAIYPQLTDENFSVKIKSLKCDKFVKADPEADGKAGNNQDVTGYTKRVSLDAEGTAFEYKVRSGNNCHFTYLNSNQTELRLSMNGSGDTDVFMGVYNGSHSGNDVAFPDYTTNMTFPISVSSSTTTNAKMISAFKEGYSGDKGNFQYGFKWYSSGNSVKMKRMHSASVANLDDFSWAIYPMPVGNNMCYAIKNIKTGKYVYATAQFANNGDHSGDEVELSEKPMYFQLNTSNGAFYYYPSGSTTTHYLSCNSTGTANEQFLGVWTLNHNGTKNEFLPLSFKVEVSDLQYSTLYSPISVKQTTYTGGDITPSVEVYSIGEEPASGYVTLTSMVGGIPANQGAILKNAGTYYFTQDSNVSADAWSSNLLQGSVTDTYVEGHAYVMANGANGVGLYKADLNKNENGETGTTHFKNNAGKAYLPATVSGGARFLVFSFGDDDATGIIETENGNVNTENSPVFDLSGRRVQKAQKGIFIVNGKIVVR